MCSQIGLMPLDRHHLGGPPLQVWFSRQVQQIHPAPVIHRQRRLNEDITDDCFGDALRLVD